MANKHCECCGQSNSGPYEICPTCIRAFARAEMAQEARPGSRTDTLETEELSEDEKQDIRDHSLWLLRQQYAQ
jgi:hypothetical protein